MAGGLLFLVLLFSCSAIEQDFSFTDGEGKQVLLLRLPAWRSEGLRYRLKQPLENTGSFFFFRYSGKVQGMLEVYDSEGATLASRAIIPSESALTLLLPLAPDCLIAGFRCQENSSGWEGVSILAAGLAPAWRGFADERQTLTIGDGVDSAELEAGVLELELAEDWAGGRWQIVIELDVVPEGSPPEPFRRAELSLWRGEQSRSFRFESNAES